MGILENKVCIVTGGAGSIGLATAKLFASEGAKVMLADLADHAPEGLSGENFAYIKTDVTDAKAVAHLISQTVDRWGEIDVVFSNAGNFGVVAPIDQYPEEIFSSVYDVHVKGAFLICKHAVPHIRDGGSIVITSSVAGTRGDPGVYGYITAKHAQIGLMRCLAKELAPRNIRVNTIHPGAIDNAFQKAVEDDLSDLLQSDGGAFFDAQTPLGRHGRADEIARSVLYLASDQSSYTTGTTLMVDGGMST
ncbi:short-chain dehydrogenase [Sedimentitalea sp. CY04]|uniref:Short-chain dehydrogenase n=1 Tax=Parasedimentitalea denitrificans TaxID=2211118 RepID=A0ABX0W3H1_9RHOB|nr:SDR family NAD(P)-dependent oxidoreductase [Sedimentitalea sp. CY04]NIZ60203.1 short-chain dehydrogenase [Sedimentitalea sp. CY04]